jgi:hypothetical protein
MDIDHASAWPPQASLQPDSHNHGEFHMDVKATVSPGANGTKALLRQYGDQLVCVRYRYDKKRHKRYKTVELIIDEKDWAPSCISYPEKRVFVRVGYGETDLRDLVKQNGGYWNPHKKAWHLSYRKVAELGLEKRMLDDELAF